MAFSSSITTLSNYGSKVRCKSRCIHGSIQCKQMNVTKVCPRFLMFCITTNLRSIVLLTQISTRFPEISWDFLKFPREYHVLNLGYQDNWSQIRSIHTYVMSHKNLKMENWDDVYVHTKILKNWKQEMATCVRVHMRETLLLWKWYTQRSSKN